MRSDAALIAAARTDSGAFRELYDRYAERVLSYHRRRSGDEDAAHELTAETFAQAWLVRARFRDECGGTAGPWLFGIARNVLLHSVRRQALEHSARERLGMRVETSAAAPEEAWLDGLDEALDALPDNQREAIRLRIEDDLDYEQVAANLGTTPAAARVRVHRGLAALRTRLAASKETR
ncbi:sigma-70 family RNA polymerase sigma factor [Solirubrobacter phytolaccae]|uniref:Sigma-70 family RNA polymerase sigma factor n=1 Tax=Solirubrobacter phytolaccae TaxID=1404360 RepID=A0A9X3S6Z4_9ACTN|nr:sigma-70 family RNA polymerase sigma factor [Solirubrobacter phytolaccae]MDA0180469.1 sigma-70 family RNA polymerase sigma factor [Solirubrobacter phytolaccae]